MLKEKKRILAFLIATLILFAIFPQLGIAEEYNLNKIEEIETRGCYEMTIYRYYNNSSSIPDRIIINDESIYGTLYFVSKEIVGVQWKAKFQGIVCPNLPQSILPKID